LKEAPENQRLIYQFGKFVLDPQEKTVLIEGQPIHLPAKEFETLLLLVENNGRALSKEEMLETIWPGTFVEENNLAKYISRLRKLLDTGGEITIETLPKHGYRFSAEVSQIIQPVDKTILEKRTTRRLSMRVQEDFDEPPLALPPARKAFPGRIFFSVLVLIGLTATAALLWFWRHPKTSAKSAESGISFLTDGQHDDNFAYWTNEGQIHFFRYMSSTRAESWTMNADGSNQHRANTEIKNLLIGNWSPDGRKVVFSKEEDPKTSYLADADGRNQIALPLVVGNMDWSPDSSQFVYQLRSSPDKSEIFLYTLKTGKNVKLSGDTYSADPSFSPDGKQIAFAGVQDGNADIYVMMADGSNVRRITNHPAFENYPVFSPDGTQIAFASNREDEHGEVYLKNLNDDSAPRRITHSNSGTGLRAKCWSPDGTQMLLYSSQNGKDQILLANIEPYPARPILSSVNEDLSFPRLAPGGKQILYQARMSDRSSELRLTNLETKQTRALFKTEPDLPIGSYLSPAWSPDEKLIAFTSKASGNTEIFTIKTDGSELRNLTNNPMLDTSPIFSPDGNEIIFVRDIYGSSQLYRMNLDGSNQRRLTDRAGYEMTPAFSPDGLHIAFAGDREGHGLDIFQLDFRNPNSEKLLVSRRLHDVSPNYSPDGRKIAFISSSDGNYEIYVMNSDGTGMFRLTHTKAEEVAPQFSKDGKSLIFASNRTGKFAIYQIELS
jgi:Tol biopolymer transport system component/DNA-binding winged helix-turn-helix (wHTH) protein